MREGGRGALPRRRVLDHLKELKQKGYKEAVLTGIHLGAYGFDLGPAASLEDLLGRVEKEETPSRIRLSSIEPRDFSPGLIALLSRSRKICPHLHIPIQSGDDEILKKMNRNYDRRFLSDLVRELHGRIPNLSIGADMIAGFPGETAGRFQSSFDLISSLPLAYLHVFPYSRREGTPAAQFPDQVGEEEIKIRADRLRDLGKEKRRTFYQRFVNQELSVLVEGRRGKEGGLRGLSRNYVPVFLGDNDDTERGTRVNEEIKVVVTGLTEKGVMGRIVEG